MGGSGGGYFISNVNELKNKINDTTKDIDRKEYDSNVAIFLSELLSHYNNRDVNAINIHLEEILKAVENKIEGHLDIKLGGSVSKHTFVDGLSDIDTLLILNDSELNDKSPKSVKNTIASMLKDRYPETNISIGAMAVTVSFSDYDIQILPALKRDGKIMIPDASGNSWTKIDTNKFTRSLTNINEKNGNKVVPLIKLTKAIIDKLPEKHKLSGYHVEALAVDIFSNYHGEQTYKEMLKYFFHQASQIVLSPTQDKTGQSVYIDEYLGTRNSLHRQIVSSAFDRLYRKLYNADNLISMETWKDIFE
jgi:hypothetical protein